MSDEKKIPLGAELEQLRKSRSMRQSISLDKKDEKTKVVLGDLNNTCYSAGPNCTSLTVGNISGGSAVGMFASQTSQVDHTPSREVKISAENVSTPTLVLSKNSSTLQNIEQPSTGRGKSSGPVHLTIKNGQEVMTVNGRTFTGKNLVCRGDAVYVDGIRHPL